MVLILVIFAPNTPLSVCVVYCVSVSVCVCDCLWLDDAWEFLGVGVTKIHVHRHHLHLATLYLVTTVRFKRLMSALLFVQLFVVLLVSKGQPCIKKYEESLLLQYSRVVIQWSGGALHRLECTDMLLKCCLFVYLFVCLWVHHICLLLFLVNRSGLAATRWQIWPSWLAVSWPCF